MQMSETNASTTLIDQDVTVADGIDYTVIVGDTLNDIKALVLTDDNGTPPAGTIRVRAVHGAKAAGPVDIYVTEPGTDLTLTSPIRKQRRLRTSLALRPDERGDVPGARDARPEPRM